jgi:type I restriction enzyme R subunit
MKNPERIEAVCADIVDHYRAKVAPLGLKGQVAAFDRELCVAYHQAITARLDPGRRPRWRMTAAKEDPVEGTLGPRARGRGSGKDRFRDPADPCAC